MGCKDSKEEKQEEAQSIIPEYKVIVIGDSAVGKTAIIHSYIQGTYADHCKHEMTIGSANQFKVADVPGADKNDKLPKKIKLDIWDTPGAQAVQNLAQIHYQGAHAVILMYSIDSVQSLKSIDEHCVNVETHCSDQTIKFLVGNKCDLENDRHNFWEDLETKAEKYDIQHIFETSAIRERSDTVKALFEEVVRELAHKAPTVAASTALRLSQHQKRPL